MLKFSILLSGSLFGMLLLFLSFTVEHNASTGASGNEQSLDQFYADFRKAYQELDTAQVSKLYFESAQYLIFDGRIAHGKPAFMPGIGIYFNDLKRQGQL